jgi:hypothetical protein
MKQGPDPLRQSSFPLTRRPSTEVLPTRWLSSHAVRQSIGSAGRSVVMQASGSGSGNLFTPGLAGAQPVAAPGTFASRLMQFFNPAPALQMQQQQQPQQPQPPINLVVPPSPAQRAQPGSRPPEIIVFPESMRPSWRDGGQLSPLRTQLQDAGLADAADEPSDEAESPREARGAPAREPRPP